MLVHKSQNSVLAHFSALHFCKQNIYELQIIAEITFNQRSLDADNQHLFHFTQNHRRSKGALSKTLATLAAGIIRSLSYASEYPLCAVAGTSLALRLWLVAFGMST